MSFRRISSTLLALLAGMSGLANAGPLSFNAALEIAERQSPNLASNRAQIQAAQASAIPAGALPDPKIFTGIDNYPVSGPDRGRLNADSMTMQKIGVMQEFPNAAKRQARVAVAEASIETAEAQRQVERLKLRRATALAWLNRYYLERKIALFDNLDKENQLWAEAVRAQIASGRTQIADSVMPKQEAVQLADRRDDLIRDLVKAKAGLRRYVGGEADEPLVDALPALNIDATHLREHLHRHPELQAFAAETRKAEAEVREAQAMKSRTGVSSLLISDAMRDSATWSPSSSRLRFLCLLQPDRIPALPPNSGNCIGSMPTVKPCCAITPTNWKTILPTTRR